MEQLQSNNKEDNSIKGRRRKTGSHQRNYTCGCGKTYLSYPALYVHLKQKHQGSPPKGTNHPNITKTNRGRPKKSEENDEQSSDDEKSLSVNEPETTLDQILQYLDGFGSFRKEQIIENEQEKQSWLVNNFPKELTTYRESIQILEYIKQITNEQIIKLINPIEKEPINKEKNIKTTVIFKSLAYFLVEIGPKLKVDIYQEICIFIILYTIQLNKMGWQAQIEYEQQKQTKDEFMEDYCNEQCGEHILLTANEFILQFLPEYYPKLGQIENTFKIFGSSNEKLKNAVYFIQYLSQWLYIMRFTNSRLALFNNEDDI